jgi:phage FluMu gp28-like protein
VPGESLHDPDAWAQEYECAFIDNSSVLLPLDLIERCESRDSTTEMTLEELSSFEGPVYCGIDFGRRHDRTVLWLLTSRPAPQSLKHLLPRGILTTRVVRVLDKVTTPAQFNLLKPLVARAKRVAVDYTGPGVGLGDMLALQFGAKVELCDFTVTFKEELFPRLRSAMERGAVFIPGRPEIREDLHGVQRQATATGQIVYRARSTPDGHSDRTVALALAVHAAERGMHSQGATAAGTRSAHLAKPFTR